MNKELSNIKKEVYDRCGLQISNFKTEDESQEYGACQFELGTLKIISRNAKITHNKVGQFVTFWKRSISGPIEPFNETDPFDVYIVNVKTELATGQFVFPKSVLIKKGILTSSGKEGKRGFRVYPSGDVPNNKQAVRTQQWQLGYFYAFNEEDWLNRVKVLYAIQ